MEGLSWKLWYFSAQNDFELSTKVTLQAFVMRLMHTSQCDKTAQLMTKLFTNLNKAKLPFPCDEQLLEK